MVAGTVSAGASTPLPSPASPQQVAKLVAAASRIQNLPNDLLPALNEASADNVGTYFPVTQYGCLRTSSCVFGNVKAHSTIVLFGDSHAQMWLTALMPIAVKFKLKLLLLWRPSCPAASVTVWNATSKSPYTLCNSWRASLLVAVHRLNPVVVLLASRNTAMTGPSNGPISDATWQAGLQHSIALVKSASTKVDVVGDITPFSSILPSCLAAYKHHIQQCSSPDPNPNYSNHFAAEKAAAKAKGVPYINPHPWLCTTVCSPVIGKLLGYYNDNHVSATYAAFLSTVWLNALHSQLP